MISLPITDTVGVLALLSGVCAFFFWLEKATRWKLFQFLPPLIFIYLVPLVLTNLPLLFGTRHGVLPASSAVYDVMHEVMLPMLLVLLLVKVNIRGALRVVGRGMGVLLFGTLGVMVGAPLGLLVVRPWLGPESWKSFGALAGSWIGGTGNLAAVGKMIDANGAQLGLAVLADSTIYIVWLPILLGSKRFADAFADFTGVASDRVEKMEQATEELGEVVAAPATRDYLSLICAAVCATWLANLIAPRLPLVEPYLTEGTWQVLLITTVGLGLSHTPLHRVAGSHELAMALLYLFVAQMGASAQLEDVGKQGAEAIAFLIAAAIWIGIHGMFCLLGARLFKTDVHTAAIASAANIGGAASASIVASYHRESLLPAAILMAMMGYALGNYCAYATALLCRWVLQG